MPLVKISVYEKADSETKKIIAACVFDAMRTAFAIPEDDRFIVLTSHPHEDFDIDPHYMDMQRTDDFVLVEVTLRRGRSVEVKQFFYREVARLLEERTGIAPDNVMIVLTEIASADISFGRGEAQYLSDAPVGLLTPARSSFIGESR
jgi:phenylpyruvate tautomerase PptA (4-oxalocrotonate tautomerase family)